MQPLPRRSTVTTISTNTTTIMTTTMTTTTNLALDGNLLSAQLETPALHVLGFENAPKTPEQKSASAAADTWLQSGKNILAVPRNAGCRLKKVDYKAPKLGSGHADYRSRGASSVRSTNSRKSRKSK